MPVPALPYLALGPRFLPASANNKVIHLAVDALTALFWFAGFIALAAWYGGFTPSDRGLVHGFCLCLRTNNIGDTERSKACHQKSSSTHCSHVNRFSSARWAPSISLPTLRATAPVPGFASLTTILVFACILADPSSGDASCSTSLFSPVRSTTSISNVPCESLGWNLDCRFEGVKVSVLMHFCGVEGVDGVSRRLRFRGVVQM
ncbi:MAG: hypothetical protein Q9173_000566 [Seirophora scorigena]